MAKLKSVASFTWSKGSEFVAKCVREIAEFVILIVSTFDLKICLIHNTLYAAALHFRLFPTQKCF
jgi:hypothetical protein